MSDRDESATVKVDDAARLTGSWGIARVRVVTEHRALLDYDDDNRAEWVALENIEYLHTPKRWADWY